jgi:hypothetical protein
VHLVHEISNPKTIPQILGKSHFRNLTPRTSKSYNF